MAADGTAQAKKLDGPELEALLARSPLQLGRGRRAAPLHSAYVRDLELADLVRKPDQPTKPASLKEIRQSHHQLCRLLAQGKSAEEISSILGTYTPSRISILKSDPMFSTLLSYYKRMEAEQYTLARADMHERLANLGFDSLELLHQRIVDDPDGFDHKTLLAIVEASADRTGFGKSSTVNHDHVHSLSPESIARIKEATQAGREIASEDRGALLRIAAERTTVIYSEAQEAEWEPCEGAGLREEGNQSTEATVAASGSEVPSVDPVRRQERERGL